MSGECCSTPTTDWRRLQALGPRAHITLVCPSVAVPIYSNWTRLHLQARLGVIYWPIALGIHCSAERQRRSQQCEELTLFGVALPCAALRAA